MATRFVDGSPLSRAIVACSCQAPPSLAQVPVATPESVRAGWLPIFVHLPGTRARVRPGMPSATQVISTPWGDSLDNGDPQEMLVADEVLVTVHGACNRSVLKKVRRSVNDDVSRYRYERHCRGWRNDSRAAGKAATVILETPGEALDTVAEVLTVLDGSVHAASGSSPVTATRSRVLNLAISLGRTVSAPGSGAVTTFGRAVRPSWDMPGGRATFVPEQPGIPGQQRSLKRHRIAVPTGREQLAVLPETIF